MRLKYFQSTLFELAHHVWWPQIKTMHLVTPEGDPPSCFKMWYDDAEKQSGENYNVLIAIYDNKPIGISMFNALDLSDEVEIDFMVFVLPEYRNMKVGTKLFNRVKQLTKARELLVYPHDHISNSFFKKVYPDRFKNQPKWFFNYWD